MKQQHSNNRQHCDRYNRYISSDIFTTSKFSKDDRHTQLEHLQLYTKEHMKLAERARRWRT